MSNDTITIKGKQFFILKMIGRGGSSKVQNNSISMICVHVFMCLFLNKTVEYLSHCLLQVYQVLDHKKQLFAVKHVDLEEADARTVESYKNEIEHLNHLQQYSDQIIKLYD